MSFGFLLGSALAVDGTRRFAGMMTGLIQIGVWIGLTIGPLILLGLVAIGGVKTGYVWLIPIPCVALWYAIRALRGKRWGRAAMFYALTAILALAVSYPMIKTHEQNTAVLAALEDRAWKLASFGYVDTSSWPQEMRDWYAGLTISKGTHEPYAATEEAFVAFRKDQSAPWRQEYVLISDREVFATYDALSERHGDWITYHETCVKKRMPLSECTDPARRETVFGIPKMG